MEISTHEERGLLLWQGVDTKDPQEFITIFIENGHAVLNVANTQVTVYGVKVNDGQNHKIEASKSSSAIKLTVDEAFSESESFGGFNVGVMRRQPVYLGECRGQCQ